MEEEKLSERSVTPSSGNIFADLGLPNPEERLAKAELAFAIRQAIQEQGLTQKAAAQRMMLDQPKVSRILSGKLAEFSTDRLMSCLLHLGLNVTVMIEKKGNPEQDGVLTVVSA